MGASGQVYRRCGCGDPGTGRAFRAGECPRLLRRGHGSWYFGIEVPVLVGGRRRVRRGGYASRKAAVEALSRFRTPDAAAAAGRAVTVGEWLEHWLATRVRQRPSTLRGYRAHARLYLIPYLGRVPLAELSVGQVQAMFTALSRGLESGDGPNTAASLARIRATLRTALNAAVRQGLVAVNPACRVELPPVRRPRAVVWTQARVEEWQRTGVRPAVAVWTAGQTGQFLQAIRGHRL